MTRAQQTAIAVSLWLLLVNSVGCAGLITAATTTVTTTSSTLESAAQAGNAEHLKAVEKITEDARAKRVELGCGSSGESLPAGCDVAAWHAYRDEAKVKLEAEKERYAKFERAIMTTHRAAVLGARAIIAYQNNKDSVDLGSVMAELAAAYTVVAGMLADWGVSVPGAPGDLPDGFGELRQFGGGTTGGAGAGR